MSVKLLTYNLLNRYEEEIVHFSSTRNEGVSEGEFASLNLGNYTDDSYEKITRNRQLLAIELGIDLSRIFNAHQVHGVAVKVVDEALTGLSEMEKKAALDGYDALVTNLSGICVTVTTADCVPVLLYDPVKKAVAAIHSGWRSTLHNICQETIFTMHRNYGTRATDLVAVIGPCISKKVYEVGEDLYAEFVSKEFDIDKFFLPKEQGKFFFDIRETVRAQLSEAGVSQMEVSSYCTYSDENLFFSARRQGLASGRMLSGIFLK
jgi:YfiH family protein